jgi:hypothetical protein
MNLRSIFIDPPQPARSAGFRYGFLVVICLLLAFNVYNFATRSPRYSGDPYGNFIIAVMLLLNHVAFQFSMPPRVAVGLRILAIAWLAFGLFYVCYLGRVLFPLR